MKVQYRLKKTLLVQHKQTYISINSSECKYFKIIIYIRLEYMSIVNFKVAFNMFVLSLKKVIKNQNPLDTRCRFATNFCIFFLLTFCSKKRNYMAGYCNCTNFLKNVILRSCFRQSLIFGYLYFK